MSHKFNGLQVVIGLHGSLTDNDSSPSLPNQIACKWSASWQPTEVCFM